MTRRSISAPTMIALAAGASLVVLAVAAWLLIAHGVSRQVAEIGGPFTLEDGAGHAVSDRDLRGHYLLVYFGYTSCPDVCPTTLNTIAAALDKLGAKGRDVQPVFITVDPSRDTPKAIRDYVAAFSPRILPLTGTSAEIAKVAREYKVYYAARNEGGKADYAVDHSSVVYLMGPDGRFIAPMRSDSAADLAGDVARYLPTS